MLLALMATLLFALPPDSTGRLYAYKDAEALARLYRETPDATVALLCRYRLYPLTQDARYLDGLPEAAPPDASARHLALLAGLWGYQAAEAGGPTALRYGLRSSHLLDQARARDPDDPFVLLIEGQSLLFKPRLAGGSAHAALERFRTLRRRLSRHADGDLPAMEADLWIWFTLARLEDEGAAALRTTLLAQEPPPLFREFLYQAR